MQCHASMVRVHLTRHLFAFFPALEGQELTVEAETLRGVVDALERLAPGIGFYLCDERGALRTHVNAFVDKHAIRDRRRLTDPTPPGVDVHFLQALSGG